MNTLRLPLALMLLLVMAGCASPSSRIAKNRTAFEAYPAEVQAKIRAGEVEVGFTPEQVAMALGKPDRVVQRTTAEGASEVWVYLEGGMQLGLGLGVGVSGGSSASAVGGEVSTGSDRDEEKLRVVISGGHVTAVEQVRKKS